MPYTNDDLERVKKAIARGQLRVTIEGKTVEYRSLSELEKIRDLIEDEINATSETPRRRTRKFRLYSEKDL